MHVFFSDVHGNLDALQAGLRHMDECYPVNLKYCLGDIVGYGPKPVECLRLVLKECGNRIVVGNHDRAALFSPNERWNDRASQAILIHRGLIEQEPDSFDLWNMIAYLPRFFRTGKFSGVHCSPLPEPDYYVHPANLARDEERPRFRQMGMSFDGLCFVGHSHIPLVIRYPKDSIDNFGFLNYDSIQDGSRVAVENNAKYLVNVGSLGQPRDGDDRPCYVVYDDVAERLIYRRVS